MDSPRTNANARHDAVSLLGISIALATCLWAHGGVLLLHQQPGPYVVSLFSADAPLRAGGQDFTVLIQNATDQSPQLNVRVTLLFRAANSGDEVVGAQSGTSANKLLYAATAHLSARVWDVTILIQPPTGPVITTKGRLTVLPKQPPIAAYWPYFVLVPAMLLLYVLNRHLKTRVKRSFPARG